MMSGYAKCEVCGAYTDNESRGFVMCVRCEVESMWLDEQWHNEQIANLERGQKEDADD